MITTSSLAQETGWKIGLNKKTILSTYTEDETINVRKITRKEWNKHGNLEVFFINPQPESWIHSVLFYDEKDNEIFSVKDISSSKTSLDSLRKLFTGKKELRLYSIVAPRDPNIAIRVRRVHLCTLRLP